MSKRTIGVNQLDEAQLRAIRRVLEAPKYELIPLSNVLPLLEHFVRDQGLGPEDIAQLRSLLDQLEAERDESGKR